MRKRHQSKKKPTYRQMISEFLFLLPHRVASPKAITKYVAEHYPVPSQCKRYVKAALRKGVDNGNFVQIRHSYRLSPSERQRLRNLGKSIKLDSDRESSGSEDEMELTPQLSPTPNAQISESTPNIEPSSPPSTPYKSIPTSADSTAQADSESDREYQRNISKRVRRRLVFDITPTQCQ
eukprot:TRINITY_DN1062_c0_g1_i1.p2 TRINITY_DN1062_c0_g1~~TRINITY_DN1062_c0_g1_i1.p2  ORF type:complete len:179 (-),score=24.24 TRINITY_DN1062_c0_g1_i1:175-711(-)